MESRNLINLIPKKIIDDYEIDSVEIIDDIPVVITRGKVNERIKQVLESIFGEDVKINSLESNEEVPDETFENILIQAISKKATDIHLEPKERSALIRLRIDGVLQNVGEVSKELYLGMLTHIKIRSKLNIAEKRLPQEGGFPFVFNRKNYDIRVSVIPTLFGEKTALRILPSDQVLKTMEALGMDSESIDVIKKALNKKSGSIIVSGPTGSGKSSTLHVLVNYLEKNDKNIITIEDPIEIVDKDLNQIQVNEEIGLTYPVLLKKILRQDPDIVLLGEIRDSETARLACEASLTGHLILTTIHTKNCESIILRLLEMKIEPYLIASSVNVIVAQRLVRKLCDNCKTLKPVSRGIFDLEEAYFANGCKQCNYTGYSGRIGIFEVIELSEKTRNFIYKFESAQNLVESIKSDCKKTLLSNAVRLIKNGTTSISEVLKIME